MHNTLITASWFISKASMV